MWGFGASGKQVLFGNSLLAKAQWLSSLSSLLIHLTSHELFDYIHLDNKPHLFVFQSLCLLCQTYLSLRVLIYNVQRITVERI